MNNGIISFAPSGTIDNRTLGTLPLNSNILNSCVSPYNYPSSNNLYEGYYNSNNYVCVIDTRVNNNLNVTIGLLLANGNASKPLTIDWGDGSYGGLLSADNMFRNGSFETVLLCGGTSLFSITHTYPSHGSYILQIGGAAQTPTNSPNSSIGLVFNCPNVISILSFGTENGLTSAYLGNNTNLTYIPPNNTPQHSGNYNAFGGMFTECSKLNHPNISKWNLNNNTSFYNMFYNCSSLNQSITGVTVNAGTSCYYMFGVNSNLSDARFDNWIFSSGNDCTYMFFNCSKFAGNGLSSWNTSGITNMYTMFGSSNTAFNQPLNTWDVSNVTTFYQMFQGCSSFNSSLSGWQLGTNSASSVSLFRMLNGATSFNQPLNSWNTSNVNSLRGTFAGCPSFNQDLSSWDTSKVTNMNATFQNDTNFNNGGASGIANWNTSNVTDMGSMFQATAFNQPIGSWNTSKVTNMQYMFYSNLSFNQPINSWNVSKVNTMFNMFGGGALFNQDISSWNLAGFNVNTALDAFMNGKTGANSFSTTNYNALLIGWNNNKSSGVNGVANWRTDLRPNFGGAKYTAGGAAATARAALVSYGWTITDGGSI